MSQNPKFKNAERHQLSILTPLEKLTLRWLAERMPAWVNSDHLTLLGFAGMILAGASYYLAQYNPLFLVAGIVCLAINWFGDSLDGTLARFRNRQRPRYGFYVDHVVDAFGVSFLVAGLGLSGYMSPNVAMGFLIAYFLVNIEIADFYATGPEIMFRFGVTIAQDLTYTIAWLIFGMLLLAAGIIAHAKPARVAAVALITVTTFKCFLYDLSSLEGLYRVGAFLGLGISLALVSLVLQKYVLAPTAPKESES